MTAIRAHFDGEQVILPPGTKRLPPGAVIIVLEDGIAIDADRAFWEKGSEEALRRVWDNEEDAAYDSL